MSETDPVRITIDVDQTGTARIVSFGEQGERAFKRVETAAAAMSGRTVASSATLDRGLAKSSQGMVVHRGEIARLSQSLNALGIGMGSTGGRAAMLAGSLATVASVGVSALTVGIVGAGIAIGTYISKMDEATKSNEEFLRTAADLDLKVKSGLFQIREAMGGRPASVEMAEEEFRILERRAEEAARRVAAIVKEKELGPGFMGDARRFLNVGGINEAEAEARTLQAQSVAAGRIAEQARHANLLRMIAKGEDQDLEVEALDLKIEELSLRLSDVVSRAEPAIARMKAAVLEARGRPEDAFQTRDVADRLETIRQLEAAGRMVEMNRTLGDQVSLTERLTNSRERLSERYRVGTDLIAEFNLEQDDGFRASLQAEEAYTKESDALGVLARQFQRLQQEAGGLGPDPRERIEAARRLAFAAQGRQRNLAILAADPWFQAGRKSGDALVDGVAQVLSSRRIDVKAFVDDLSQSISREFVNALLNATIRKPIEAAFERLFLSIGQILGLTQVGAGGGGTTSGGGGGAGGGPVFSPSGALAAAPAPLVRVYLQNEPAPVVSEEVFNRLPPDRRRGFVRQAATLPGRSGRRTSE